MSQAKHTPGPWTACKDGECSCGQVFGGGDKHVATVHAATQDSDGTTYAEWSEEERRANVRLVESAPKLLATLESAVDVINGVLIYHRYVISTPARKALTEASKAAEAVIAEAKGEA